MKKITIIALSIFLSFSVQAQQEVLIAQSKQGQYYLQKNSFTKTMENNDEFIGVTINLKKPNEEEYIATNFFKMDSKICKNKKGTLLQYNNNKQLTSNTVSLEGEPNSFGLLPSIAYVICVTKESFDEKPDLYDTTWQTVRNKILKEPTHAWKNLYSEPTASYLPKHIKFEEQSVTVPLLIKKDSQEYYKAFISKEFCRDEQGYMRVYDLEGEELEGKPFDLNKNLKDSYPYIQELAIEMCKYTMANHKFKKKIVIKEDGTIITKEATK